MATLLRSGGVAPVSALPRPSLLAPSTPLLATRAFSSSRGALSLMTFFDSSKGWEWLPTSFPTGRPWSPSDLRTKSFEDLHALWWTCLREQNKLASQQAEARRFRLLFPHAERIVAVRATMRHIKTVLWERRRAYLQAQEIVKRESIKQALMESGIPPAEAASQFADAFPVALADIGRARPRVLRPMNKRRRQLFHLSPVPGSLFRYRKGTKRKDAAPRRPFIV